MFVCMQVIERAAECYKNKSYLRVSSIIQSEGTFGQIGVQLLEDKELEQEIKRRLNLEQKAKIIYERGPEIDRMQIPQYTYVPSLKTFVYVKVYNPESKRWSSQFMCEFKNCMMNFKKWNNLFDHLRAHCDERPYHCPVDGCSKQFTQKSNLEKHMKIHKNKCYLRCSVCKRLFTKNKIIDHFQVHENLGDIDDSQIQAIDTQFEMLNNQNSDEVPNQNQ
ncbi:krueppel-like factor 11 [Stylonychia lemnae]|uniref:Krueppel-like factor 11 n=1 Tax=Stylonychia lemnae TaxID=5949 RepID=A0A077ZQ37_STYLE|nr:krueppel-like factor 11 [Stylonychia lemnae]|eukprot:CDW72047.1 krueppel-like factor 11 [Stylonychia lemnae]